MIPLRALIQLATQVSERQKTRSIKLRLYYGMYAELMDRPGLWMSDAELSQTTLNLRRVYSQALSDKIPEYGALVGDREDMKNRLICIVFDANNQPVAFSAQARLQLQSGGLIEEVIHLGLVAIDTRMKGRGLQGVLYALPIVYLFFASGLQQLYFTNVTQVPAIIGQAEDYLTDVFPSSDTNQKQSYHHYRVASAVYKQYKHIFGVGEDSNFIADTQIIENSYTGGSDELKKSFSQCAPHRREAVNEFCRLSLNYDRGDDFLQVGRMDYTASLSFLRARQAGLLRRTFSAIVTSSLESVVIPTIRWLVNG